MGPQFSEAEYNKVKRHYESDDFQKLSPKEQKLIELRYGLGENRAHSYQELSDDWIMVTRERVRQIIKRAIRRLDMLPADKQAEHCLYESLRGRSKFKCGYHQ